MHLERLEIHGFKSFRDKTVLEFPDKFTAIVGPNGSGKSNIVDAICFVLGKSRGLRVGNLRELIYNGGVDGKESDHTKVSIYLNNGGKKIRISREVNTEGQSLYRIDKKRASRQEVVEIVGDNEYNIILQDDVTGVIEMLPKERRQIIDDLCGIGEYNKKKAKALKELETVENRISDTHIILGEKQGYMEQLGKERNDALQHQELSKDLEKCRASILYKNIEGVEKKLEGIDSGLTELMDEENNLKEKINKIKRDIEEKNKELKQINSEIVGLEEEKSLGKIPGIRGELSRKQDKLESLNKVLEDDKKTIHEKKEKRSKLISNINSLEAKLRAAKERLEFLNDQILEESKKIKGLEVEEKIDTLKNHIFELRSKVTSLVESEESNKKRIEDFLRQKDGITERIHELLQQEKELEKRIKERDKQHKGEFEEFEQLRKRLPELEEKIDGMQSRLESLRVEYAAKKTEIETVEKSSGGLKGAISAINKLKGIIDGVHGPVFQLGRVLNPEYDEAMKIAAGGRMYDVLVENEDTAIKCIKYLREKKIGRATFLPLNRITFRRQDKAPKGAIGFARDFITTNARFKPAFDYVFGNTLLVRSLEDAKKIGVGRFRMVTLDGDLLTESGAMTGGYTRKIEIGFSRADELEKDLKELEQRIIDLDGERQELLLEKKKVGDMLSKLEAPVTNIITDVERIRLEKGSLGDKLGDLRYRTEEIEDIVKKIKQEITENKGEARSLEGEIKNKEKELAVLLKKRSETNIDKLEKLKDDYRDLEVEEKTLTEKRELIKQQIGDLDDEIEKLNEKKTGLETDIQEVMESCEGLEKELQVMEKENTKLMEKLGVLIEDRSAIEDEITSLGSGRGETELKLESAKEEINSQLIKKASLETRLSDLREEYKPYLEMEVLDEGLKRLESRISEITTSLEALGSVNMRAIETYEIIRREFDETVEKLETLKNERQSIFDFMEKVEQKKRETFMAAFDFVKNGFEQIYGELANGEGTLILDNPRDISDSGLIIKASPEGKKLINIDAMSGGEKVLTCSAFLLAIQRYKPSYFYIVDEIDASLDRANSLKLADILRNSAAQFLIISHNNEVIKKAESVIGVSMSNGVSQIVGVKLT
ncbi:MAG: chromosome segregation protein SMC [Candidatus Altiarchaeota archaeon]|nr:chromosome segregation protein SMC [Candidatus Altiarchaeota archaeon]